MGWIRTSSYCFRYGKKRESHSMRYTKSALLLEFHSASMGLKLREYMYSPHQDRWSMMIILDFSSIPRLFGFWESSNEGRTITLNTPLATSHSCSSALPDYLDRKRWWVGYLRPSRLHNWGDLWALNNRAQHTGKHENQSEFADKIHARWYSTRPLLSTKKLQKKRRTSQNFHKTNHLRGQGGENSEITFNAWNADLKYVDSEPMGRDIFAEAGPMRQRQVVAWSICLTGRYHYVI